LRGKSGFSQTFGFDLLCSRLGLGCRTLGLCRAGLLLGYKARGSGVRCFGLLLGATHGFGGCLVLSRRTRQGSLFGDLLGPQLFGSLIGRTAFGVDPLQGQPNQFLFLLHSGCGGAHQFGGSSLIAPGCLQRALLSLDSRAKRGFGQTFGLCLGSHALHLCRVGLLLGGEARVGGAPCFGFLFGATPGFAGRLLFHRRTCARRGFGLPLDTRLLGSLIGRVSLGGGALCGEEGQFLFFPDSGRGGGSQVDGGALIALGFREDSLLFRDSSP
jgi:hypothetical protein